MPRIQQIIDIRMIGVDKAIADMDAYFSSALAGIIGAVRTTANKIAQKAATSLRRGKYKAWETGELARAHSVKMAQVTTNKVTAEVHNKKRYAIYVHNGTRRMRKRPWLRVAAIQEEDLFVKRIARALKKSHGIGVFAAQQLHRTIVTDQKTVSGVINI